MTKAFPRATLSAVVIIEETIPEAFFLDLIDRIDAAFSGFELVIVANGVDRGTAESIKSLLTRIPDATAHLLLHRVDLEAARLFGLDNALSDWVLLIDPARDQLDQLPAMLDRALDGNDGVIVDSGWRPRLRAYDLLANRFIGFARFMTGIDVERSLAPLRLFNRAVCLRIVNDPYGELLIRASDIAGGFRLARIAGRYVPPAADEKRRIGRGLRKGIGVLIRSSSLPLRIVSMGSFLVGALSLLYTIYVIVIYLFKADVAPGWTTTSLQLAVLMVMVSLMFWMIAEYIMAIRAALPPRRRIVVARELRSERTLSSGLLNVIDGEGRNYRLGCNAPDAPSGHAVS